jgi:hypothetical protein
MGSHDIRWRWLNAADYAHLDATAAWGASVGDRLVFVVTQGLPEDLEDGVHDDSAVVGDAQVDEESGDAHEASPSPVYSTWAVLTADEDGFGGLDPLDSHHTLEGAQASLQEDLEEWKRHREQS